MDRREQASALRENILASIKHEEIRRARAYVFTALIASIASSLGIVFAFKSMLQGLYQSSFYSYFSLFFSDPDIAISYWRDLALSLVETAPLVGITLSLIALAVLLTSMRVLVNNTKSRLIMISFNS